MLKVVFEINFKIKIKELFKDYEQNGWQLGYQVQLNGIGIEGMANDINVEDSDSGLFI